MRSKVALLALMGLLAVAHAKPWGPRALLGWGSGSDCAAPCDPQPVCDDGCGQPGSSGCKTTVIVVDKTIPKVNMGKCATTVTTSCPVECTDDNKYQYITPCDIQPPPCEEGCHAKKVPDQHQNIWGGGKLSADDCADIAEHVDQYVGEALCGQNGVPESAKTNCFSGSSSCNKCQTDKPCEQHQASCAAPAPCKEEKPCKPKKVKAYKPKKQAPCPPSPCPPSPCPASPVPCATPSVPALPVPELCEDACNCNFKPRTQCYGEADLQQECSPSCTPKKPCQKPCHDECDHSCDDSCDDSCNHSCDDSCNHSCDDSCDNSCDNSCSSSTVEKECENLIIQVVDKNKPKAQQPVKCDPAKLQWTVPKPCKL